MRGVTPRPSREHTSAMPIYRVHFAAAHTDPIPPVESLLTVDANDPISAVEQLCLFREGRVPQAGSMRWARVILTVAENGRPRHVLRVPITVDRQVPLNWQSPGGAPPRKEPSS